VCNENFPEKSVTYWDMSLYVNGICRKWNDSTWWQLRIIHCGLKD
jgi:hypothetical protein